MPRTILALAVLLSILAVLPCSAQIAPDAQKIAAVAAGTITEAKASWWGFDPEDATANLQAAIDSAVPKLVVDKMAGPWIVTPMQLVSHQEITFQEGVEVLAKRGEFKSIGACLFKARGCENLSIIGYGATWRMWRDDYGNPDLYDPAEWRHCLFLSGCNNVKVYGLTLAESGGDGIYLGSGTGRTPNRNVHIKDVTADRNHRQGISVINAENLLIEDTILRDTDGTPPCAGIDFEPNSPEERLVNCVMRNCQISGNAGNGIVLALRPMDATSEDISLRFENCTSTGDTGSVRIDMSCDAEGAPDGTIEFVDCVLADSTGSGISIAKPATRAHTRFVNCSVINPAPEKANINPIMMLSLQSSTGAVGGVEFVDCVVSDAPERNPIGYVDAGGVGLADITGTLIIDTDGQRETVPLTPEILAEWMPITVWRDIPHMTLEGLTMQPLVAELPAEPFAFGHAIARSRGHWILYASEGDEVSLTVHFGQVGGYRGVPLPVTVTGPSGEAVHSVEAPFMQDSEVTFTAPATGLYRIDAAPGANLMYVIASSHPLNIAGEGGPIRLISSTGDFYFWVPAGTREFGVRVAGQGEGEGVRAVLINPDGEVVDEVDNSAATYQFEVDLPEGTPGQAWLLRLTKPTVMPMEDHHVDLRGVPPLLAPSPEALIVPAQ